MSKGVIIIKDNKAFIAVNTQRRPREEDYFDIQETHFNADRYNSDVADWQSIVDKAELIELDTSTIGEALYDLLRSHGRKVDYTVSAEDYRYVSFKFKVEREVKITPIRMLAPKCVTTNVLFVVSRYNEDLRWLEIFTDNYLIINKGQNNLSYIFANKFQRPNYGGNQYDICQFIVDNYDNLPELMCFVQGFPFDHCHKDVSHQLVNNTSFTALESYGGIPEGEYHKKDVDGGYMEPNNSWYIAAHNEKLLSENKEITCKFDSYDDFMHSLFSDYQPLDFIRFTPGSQYIVTKQDCLHYSKAFWQRLMAFLPKTDVNGGTEAHLLERALFYIFKDKFTERT
mgnify:CR=1 FL=1